MVFGRQLCHCDHELRGASNCRKCGIYLSENVAVKTQGYCNPIHLSMKIYKKHMKRRQAKVIPIKQISEATYNLLTSICDKFLYTQETLTLGLFIYQNLKDLSPHEKFWASCCLMVASKGIQLDKNVPYLNRYQRYADKDHTQEQYETAERIIFQAMNFDIQYSTFMTFINFYLTCGVIYSVDELNKSLVQYFQDDVILKAKDYLRKASFAQYDQEKLALFIIKDTRKKYNLPEWNQELTKLTGFESSDISIDSEEKVLQQRKNEFNYGTSTANVSASMSLSKHQKVVDLKNICIRKKIDDLSITKTLVKNTRVNSSTKQNTFSSAYQGSQNVIGNSIKPKSNIVLAPINTQYLSNSSIFNLATKRR